MALTKCRECEKEVSTTAEKCPHCGAILPGESKKALKVRNVIVIAAFVILLSIFLIFWVNFQKEWDHSHKAFEKRWTESEKTFEKEKQDFDKEWADSQKDFKKLFNSR